MAQLKTVDLFCFQEEVRSNQVISSPQKEPNPLLVEPSPQPEIETATPKEEEVVFNYQIKKAESIYNPIIFKAANDHNVDVYIIKAIIMAESGYNSRSVSRRGAKGLMQLMPSTANAMGVRNVLDPEENIHAGVKYYKSLLNRFGDDEKLALAAYNAGARNVRKYKGVPPFKETRNYIKKVLKYQRFYKQGPIKEEKVTA